MTQHTFATFSSPSSSTASAAPLVLQALAGPPLDAIRIDSAQPVTIGRAAECDIRLEDPVVSKRHAAVSPLGGSWVARDLGSRHGTFLNGVRLVPHEAVPLSEGDLLTIKPWVFQTRTRPPDPAMTCVASDHTPVDAAAESISRAPMPDLGIHEQYDQLISASGAIYGASSIGELARAILERAIAATGFHRAAVIRQLDVAGQNTRSGSEFEVLASVPISPTAGSSFDFSRSLIRAASSGTPALMIAPSGPLPTGSVVRLGITRALCLPILVEGTVWGYLYLDARRGEATPRDDAVAFCGALVEMAGLAVANIKGRELRRRLADLQGDIEAAAHVQRLIMPAAEGRLGAIAYAVRSQPGRLLSGDLFDVVPLKDGRTAVMLGDVAGKGVSAAFLMAVAQTLVRSLLARFDDPAVVLDELNSYLAQMHDGSRFISLWLAVLDPGAATLTAADGGHGYSVLIGPDQPAGRLICAGGPVVGADAGCRYASSTIPWPRGSRIVLFSDGIVEQCGASGGSFGMSRIMESLVPNASPREDVAGLFACLERYAGTKAFTDDVTIASISLEGGGGKPH